MVREHDEHLLPHDPTLGRKGRQVTGSSEGLSCSSASLEAKAGRFQGVWRELLVGPTGLLLLPPRR